MFEPFRDRYFKFTLRDTAPEPVIYIIIAGVLQNASHQILVSNSIKSVEPIRFRAQTPLVIREGRLESEFVLRAGKEIVSESIDNASVRLFH
jgi:hypothetical protein